MERRFIEVAMYRIRINNMYTVNIKNAFESETRGIFVLDVEYFKDDILITVLSYRISEPDSVKELINNQIKQYKKVDAVDLGTLIGSVDLTVAEPTEVPPTDQEIYETAKNNLRQLKEDLDLGLVSQDEYDGVLTQTKKLKP